MNEPILFKPFNKIRKSIEGKDAYAHCHNGHDLHTIKTIDIDLEGTYRGIHDVPSIPDRLADHFKLQIYKWEDYCDDTFSTYKEYCNAQDSISWSLDVQGVFEGWEVVLVRDILSRGDRNDVVIDYGSHIGWYAIQAARFGYAVAAIDADYECNKMVLENAKLNDVSDRIFVYGGYVDQTSPALLSDAEVVHFWKCDIEGLDKYAYAMSKELFKAKKINYAMLEVSPCFNDSYTDLVKNIVGCGYSVYQVPHKGAPFMNEYSEYPIETLKKYGEIQVSKIEEYMSSIRQEDLIFIRKGL